MLPFIVAYAFNFTLTITLMKLPSGEPLKAKWWWFVATVSFLPGFAAFALFR